MVRVVFEQVSTATSHNPTVGYGHPAVVEHEGHRYTFAGVSYRELSSCERFLKVLCAIGIFTAVLFSLFAAVAFECFRDLTDRVIVEIRDNNEPIFHYTPVIVPPPPSESESSSSSSENRGPEYETADSADRPLLNASKLDHLFIEGPQPYSGLTKLDVLLNRVDSGVIFHFNDAVQKNVWPSAISSATCCILSCASHESFAKQQFVFQKPDGSNFTKEELVEEMQKMKDVVQAKLVGTDRFAALGAVLIIKDQEGRLFDLSVQINSNNVVGSSLSLVPASAAHLGNKLAQFGFYPDEILGVDGTFVQSQFYEHLEG